MLSAHDIRKVKEQVRKDLGVFLCEQRNTKGLSQYGLAGRLGVSGDDHTVRRWEKGERMPTDENLAALSEALDFSLAEVLRVVIESLQEAERAMGGEQGGRGESE